MKVSPRVEGFLLGVAATGLLIISTKTLINYYSSWNRDEADDECRSLFYGTDPGVNGKGFPDTKTIDSLTLKRLTTVEPDYERLPFDLYKKVVELLPLVCVDIICKRKSDGKFILFYRRDSPAAGLWWWPGGRLFRGETFFDAAVRKVRDETGNKDLVVRPVGVVDVWNTFFPDSHWDKERTPGREGTQTVNVTVVCEIEDSLTVDSSAQSTWAVEAFQWVTAGEALEEGRFDKYVSLNVRKARALGLLA